MDFQSKISEVKQFISRDIWKHEGETGLRGFGIKGLKVLLITFKEVKKDQILLKASAVTYLTILSIVPMLALVFGISKGFGFAINVQDELSKLFPSQEIVMTTTFEFAQKMLDSAKGGVIAGASTLVLIYTAMLLLNNIEDVFNSIWGKQTARVWIRKFTDYLAILVVAPTLIILSSSTTVYLATQIRTVGERFEMEFYSAPLAVFLVTISPYILISLLYTLIYIIMPNTRVKIQSGVWAGILAGTAFQLTQWGFINFQVLLTKYNAIYGSLAALPLLFIFARISWMIVFVGGEFSFALEKVNEYIPDERDVQFSFKERKRIALAVVRSIAKAFGTNEPPYTKRKLSQELGIPHRFVSNAINRLVESGVLIKSMPAEGNVHVYTPAMDINQMDIQSVCDRIEMSGEGDLFTKDNEDLKKLFDSIDSMDADTAKSKSNVLLKDI